MLCYKTPRHKSRLITPTSTMCGSISTNVGLLRAICFRSVVQTQADSEQRCVALFQPCPNSTNLGPPPADFANVGQVLADFGQIWATSTTSALPWAAFVWKWFKNWAELDQMLVASGQLCPMSIKFGPRSANLGRSGPMVGRF